MVKINMMCGKHNFGPDWVHVDGNTDYDHIKTNDFMRAGMGDNTVDVLYCSHGIAYFDREEIKDLFASWYRILKPGSFLKLSTPDWDFLRTLPRPLIGPLYGRMGMDGKLIYHKTVYSYDELYQVLRAAGFISIERSVPAFFPAHDQSEATYDGKLISLNVQCIKP